MWLKSLAKRRNFRSLNQLAGDLCEEMEEERRPRSIGAKLSELQKGEPTWWENHSDWSERLASLLEVDPSDLGIHLGSRKSTQYRFEGFPELTPLNLIRETPCELGAFRGDDRDCGHVVEQWLGTAGAGLSGGSPPKGVTWVSFPNGSGLDLFWSRLRATGLWEMTECEAVADAKERLQGPTPFCMKVSDSKGGVDRHALTQRHGQSRVLIVAPFRLSEAPGDEKPKSTLERLLETVSENQIEECEFKLGADWKNRLVQWIGARSGATEGSDWSTDALLEWIQRLPDSVAVERPRELVEIAGMVYRRGSDCLPEPVDGDAAETLLSLLPSDYPEELRQPFLRLVDTWVFTADIPWKRWIQATDWGRLDSRLREGGCLQVLMENHESAEAEEDLAAELEGPEASCREGFVQKFARTAYVEGHATGARMLVPGIVAQVYGLERVRRSIVTEDHRRWGVLCFDPDRFALILDALAMLDEQELQEVAVRVVRDSVRDAGAIGAAEALFTAVGRAGWSSRKIPDPMIDIRDRVLGRLRETTGSIAPLSSAAADPHYWLAACWAFSLASDAPRQSLPQLWENLFPGWTENPDLQPFFLFETPDSEAAFQELSLSQRSLMQLVGKVITRLRGIPEQSHPLFHARLFYEGLHREWEVPDEWCQTVCSMRWAQDLLAEEDWQEDSAKRALVLLFSAASRSAIDVQMRFLAQFEEGAPPGLLKTLLCRANPDQLVSDLCPRELDLAIAVFPLLPEDYQRALLESCRTRAGPDQWWSKLSTVVTAKHSENVASWVSNSGPETLWVVRWLWKEDPERVIGLLNEGGGEVSAYILLESFSGGTRELAQVVEALERGLPEVREEVVIDFAMQQIPTAGHLAQRLLDLAGKAQASSGSGNEQ